MTRGLTLANQLLRCAHVQFINGFQIDRQRFADAINSLKGLWCGSEYAGKSAESVDQSFREWFDIPSWEKAA